MARNRGFVQTRDPGVVVELLAEFVREARLTVAENVFRILTGPPGQGGTPRKTGHASANWIPSEGKPADGVVGSPTAVSTEPQRAAMDRLRAAYSGGDLFLTNNVDYLTLLNNGSSQQAPSGFVQLAIARGLQQAAEDLR